MMDDRPREKKSIKIEVPTMVRGYYSGDQPNPNLRSFVEEHLKEHPYDPETDDYNVPAFNESITTTKATAIYNMHTYWSKKPHDAIQQYIQHYTKEGDLVLDPFCGSGGTALAALMAGRKAIAVDRSPAATFITKNYCTPVDVDELKKAFEELKAKVKPEIDWLYETRCDRCGGKATTAYTVYSEIFQCSRCMEKVPMSDCIESEGETNAGKLKKIKVCPFCYHNGNIEEINPRYKRFGSEPVFSSYICKNGCEPKRSVRKHDDSDPKKREYFEKYDLQKLREIEGIEIPYWYPSDRMIHAPENQKSWGLLWRKGYHWNINNISDFFTKRNLWALSLILHNINNTNNYRDQLLFTFTSILFKSSLMMAHNSDGIGRIQKCTYFMPSISHVINVGSFFYEAFSDMISGWMNVKLKENRLIISTSDSRLLSIPDSSIDYIFTDPPYAEKVQFGELNFFWETWLKLNTNWLDDEIIINPTRGLTEKDWANRMLFVLKECYRVLKPGRYMSLCYHDTSEGTWALLLDLAAQVGFILNKNENILFIDANQKSIKQITSDKVIKRDLLINFRKSIPNEVASGLIVTGDEDNITFTEKVTTIVRDYLSTNPGATKDRIYDDLVSHMIRSGQMEAHDFNTILICIAEPSKEYGKENAERWYLKETELEIVDTAESAKEDAAAEIINSAISKRLEKNPEAEGVHYSDIFEHYIYAVKNKPRRPLADWLPDYCFKTSEGTYRLPITEEEEEIKKEGRSKGLNRRIKRYIAFLEQGVSIIDEERPSDATLLDWIRHCRRSGMYEQGKLLYERGGITIDGLSDEQQVDVDENYQACIRALDRIGISPDKKKVNKSKK